MKLYRILFLCILWLGIRHTAFAVQIDSTTNGDIINHISSLVEVADTGAPAKVVETSKPVVLSPIGIDSATSGQKVYSPRKAALRSAIIPGWGQAYNKKYWKVPIVWAALGITGYIFFDNLKTFNQLDYAYKVMVDKDTANFNNVAPWLQSWVQTGGSYAQNAIFNQRSQFRKYIDYSALVFILFWGLNVVDATVDAHLKGFDVSDNLSMRIKPNILSGSQTIGLTMSFDLHKAKTKLNTLPQYR